MRRGVRPPRARAAAAALAAALLPPAAHAEDLLTLVQAAHAYDATYLAARATAESAPYRAAQVQAQALPQLRASASATRGQTDLRSNGWRDTSNAAAGLNASQQLFNRATQVGIEQAGLDVRSAQADLDAAEQDLIVRVAQAYFDVLAAQDALATTRASKAAIAEQLASARRNFEVGTATITDTREAQARSDLAVAQEIAAENDLRTRRVTLDQLVGRSGVAPNPLAAPVEQPPLAAGDTDALAAQADAVHPALRRARLQLDIARLETRKARAQRLPTLDAIGSVGVGNATGAVSQPGNSKTATLGLQLNLPLYTGGSIDNRVRETTVLEERAREQLEGARRSVAETLRRSALQVDSLAAQVKALEAAESSSLLALEATQTGYRVGVRVNVDVLNAQTQLFQTRRDLAKARYDLLTATLRLRQAAGQLGLDDVAAVNRLLAR